MFEAFVGAARILGDPTTWGIMFIGSVAGIAIGILPGLGAMTTVALLLPFVWRAPPQIGLILLLAICASAMISGCITGILLSVVGEESSVVSIIDGHPMTVKGEGARAIGAGLSSSLIGSLIAVGMAFVMIPIVRPLVMAFKSSELFLLGMLGISFIAVLIERSVIKGVVSGGLGILIGLMGFHPLTGVDRFAFGSLFLYGGFNLAVVLIGLFGLSEMFDLVLKGQTSISKTEVARTRMKDVFKGTMDCIRRPGLLLRSAVIGYVVGVIPATGAMVAQWVAYGQARQTSKTPEQFGKGCVEGVIAPECSKSAVLAGALLTTLSLGIPGSAIMALFLGAFMMVGVTPGPMLILQHLDLVFLLLLGIAASSVISFVICYAAAGQLCKIVFAPTDFLYPLTLALILSASYATTGQMWDIVVVICAGLLGLFMERFGYSRPALCLGFVLGKLLEYYFLTAFKIGGPLFFLTPLSLGILAVMVALLLYPYSKNLRQRWRKA